jgi:hypothetical protein
MTACCYIFKLHLVSLSGGLEQECWFLPGFYDHGYTNYVYTDHKTGNGCEGVDRIHLAQDRVQWRDVVNTVMKLRII